MPREGRRVRQSAPGGKFGWRKTSRIHAGSPLAHTRPGSPTPGPNVMRRLTASNSSKVRPGAVQMSLQRRTF